MNLDRTRTKHGILPETGRCYTCGVNLGYVGATKRGAKYYCSLSCMRRRPPKMVLVEMKWGESFASLALNHLNRGGTVQALADMCGVHKQAVTKWLKMLGIEKHVIWKKREVS